MDRNARKRPTLPAASVLLLLVLSCGSLPVAAPVTPSPPVSANATGSQPAPVAATSCKLPVSGLLPGSGGFLQMPGGSFKPDPASNIPAPGQADQAGLRRGYTYDPVHAKWLPVPRDWVMPDFSAYVYVGNEMVTSNQPALHRVDVTSGKDALWPHGADLYGYPVALRPEGVYGAPGPEILVLLDPTGVRFTVDSGDDGLFEVIAQSQYYATRWDTGSGNQFALGDVYRIDANTGTAVLWFSDPSTTNVPIGLDAAGDPIIAGGALSRRGQMVATHIWIASSPSTGESTASGARQGALPQATLLYADNLNPLVILGAPIASRGALWFETDHGLYEFNDNGGFRQVSTFSGYISGGCL
jgi:hypothetical protein